MICPAAPLSNDLSRRPSTKGFIPPPFYQMIVPQSRYQMIYPTQLTVLDYFWPEYFNYYLIGTITHLHYIVVLYNLNYYACSYSFPIRMDAYFVCVASIALKNTIHKKVHTPSTYQFQ